MKLELGVWKDMYVKLGLFKVTKSFDDKRIMH
jgi:hypothetical protein